MAEGNGKTAMADAKLPDTDSVTLTVYGWAVDATFHSLKAAMLMNGGAVLALLTFVGHLVTKAGGSANIGVTLASRLCWGLAIYVAGVCFTGGAYLCNHHQGDAGAYVRLLRSKKSGTPPATAAEAKEIDATIQKLVKVELRYRKLEHWALALALGAFAIGGAVSVWAFWGLRS